jgi:hypothetical protein
MVAGLGEFGADGPDGILHQPFIMHPLVVSFVSPANMLVAVANKGMLVLSPHAE